MAAYAAVVSLKKTIERILESSLVSLVPPSPQIIQLAHKELKTLQEILQRLDSTSKSKCRKKVNALDERIKDAVWKLEDLLESHLSGQILSQFETPPRQLKLTSIRRNIQRRRRRLWEYFSALCNAPSSNEEEEEEEDVLLFSIDLQGLRHDVGSFIDAVKDMEKEYIYELDNVGEEEESISSRISFGGTNSSKMVGLSDQFEEVKRNVMVGYHGSVSLVGMAGIGKTALAMEIFEDSLIVSTFEYRVWVKVGRKYEFNEIARAILAQLEPNVIYKDEKIVEYLKERLEGKKCLIVLDDVWDREVLDYLTSSLPDKNNGGRIQMLFTAREALVVVKNRGVIEWLRFLNEEESEELLCRKVFGENVFPHQLEKDGKKIAENCEGLPLMIVTVADHLLEAEKTPEYWNEVAEKRNSVFVDAYDKISKVLLPSYEYLSQHLKMVFLYMGIFPQGYEIPKSKLRDILTAEGFLESYMGQASEGFILGCVETLATWKSLVITKQTSISWFMHISYPMKTVRLHSAWQHLCKGEARKNKTFHIINSLMDGLEEDIDGQRRLCLHSNVLFGFKEVYNSVRRDCASTIRSFLCFGLYHQYPVPLNVGFKLLRVLDALKVRSYHFPIEILNLVVLQYLALTCNGKLPTSISKLINLQFLIIHPHMSIISCGARSYVPVQIWDMQELKHVEILGSTLPNPNCARSSLEKLSTLLGVSVTSCTREVLKKIPNIKKLGIQIELAPGDDDSNPLSWFGHIWELQKLETLKCSIVNPKLPPTPTPLSTFPSRLRKLHLSGTGYPWKYMKLIGSLQNLQVLKLRCYAFQGPKWETKKKSFSSLKYLLIEDTDLVQWKHKSGSFPKLSYLSMRNCYKLEELQWPSDFYCKRIELVDCNPLAVTSAKKKKHRHPDVTATWLK